MPDQTRTVAPGYEPNTVILEDKTEAPIPEGWELLPAGDAGVTRRVKALGPSWTVKEWFRRRSFTRGVLAPAENIRQAREEIEAKRADPKYDRQLEQARKRREATQEVYVEDFKGAILTFLNFLPDHQKLAQRLADAVAEHATPVGSGTVARTETIAIEDRATAATIAWMRHHTTHYDHMNIGRSKSARGEVRAELNQKSHALLQVYRTEERVPANCPLKKALKKTPPPRSTTPRDDEQE